MIRTMLSFLSFMAIVNLLALLIVVGWLWQSDRLSMDRVHQVRELFASTTTQEQERKQADAAQAQLESDQVLNEARRANPPASSHNRFVELAELRERERQSQERLEQEKQALLRQLQQARDEVEANNLAFQQEKDAWVRATEQERQRKVDEQFAQTVRLYESATPKLAKQWLVNLVDDGQIDQAVAYIDAMNARSAGRIIGQLKTAAESRLAKDLLERLRTFGLTTEGNEDSANDDTAIANASNTQPGSG